MYPTPSYLEPPELIGLPDPAHSPATRKFQGIPSLAVSPAGRLWATWYAGDTPHEDHNNYAVLATSGDNGITWDEVLVVDPDGSGPVRAFDPELWLDPCQRLWFFWTQSIGLNGTTAGVWAITTDRPDQPTPAWSAPRRLTDGVMMCKPLVVSWNEWILPASTWKETDHSARVVVSADAGRTWSLRGGCQVPTEDRSCDEHMLIERPDRSLWMLVRTIYGIGESVSYDRGKSWSGLTPSVIRHPASRFFIRRLASGNLLLVKHGPIAKRTDRSHLSAYLSRDEGQSWFGGLLLDARENISYPDGQQDLHGTIRIVYDRSRTGAREILMAQFREDDILTATPGSATLPLHLIVSRPTPNLRETARSQPVLTPNLPG